VSFPAYDCYRDSGVEWLGEVPSHWRLTRVKDVAEVINGFPFDSAGFDPELGMPLIRIRDLNSETAEVRFAGPPVPAAEVTSDDVLIGMDGDFNVGRWRGAERALLNQRVCALRVQDYALSRFLEMALVDPLKRINALTYSTTVKHLSSYQVSAIRLALPSSTEELNAIAAFLDRETGKIDALVEAQRRLIELLKEKRQAVISHAVTKGLDPTAPMKDSGIEWLGEVPGHWEVRKFTQAISVQEGPGIMAVDFVDDGVPLLRVAGAQGRWATLKGCNYLDPEQVAKRWKHFRLNVGDLVISGSASTGTVCEIGPETGGSVPYTGLMRLVPIAGLTEKHFVRALVSSSMFFTQIDLLKAGATIQHYGPTHLARMVVTLPPVEEQEQIAEFVDLTIDRYAGLVREAEAGIELLQERRRALISAAVTGKIDVRGLVPEQAEAA